jgi:putative DNA primase/helicase
MITTPAPLAANPLAFALARLVKVASSGADHTARCPAHEDARPSLKVSLAQDKRILLHCYAGCDLDAILRALELSATDLYVDPKHGRRVVAVYDYRDEASQLLRQVIRYAPKGFAQRRPDGRGGWSWDAQGVCDTLYRLPHLRDQTRVFVVEGEKDVDRLVSSRQCAATTNPGGARKWTEALTDQLVRARAGGAHPAGRR